LLPQKPLAVRGDAMLEAGWLKMQEGKFGFLTGPLDEVQLFDIFHARWFGILLALTAVSTGAYVVSRLPGAWRAVTQPRKRVPDRFFETAPNRLEVAEALDTERLEEALRRARYRLKRCTSTVNSPCAFAGYKFYQSAYFGFGAEVQVRDLQTGNTIYRETLALAGTAKAPHVVLRDGAGTVLVDQTLVLTDELNGKDFTYRGTLVRLPSGRLVSVGLQTADDGDERLAVLEPGQGDGLVQLSLAEGESGDSGGLQVSYQ